MADPLQPILRNVKNKVDSRVTRPWFTLQRLSILTVRTPGELAQALNQFHVVLPEEQMQLLFNSFLSADGKFDFPLLADTLYAPQKLAARTASAARSKPQSPAPASGPGYGEPAPGPAETAYQDASAYQQQQYGQSSSPLPAAGTRAMGSASASPPQRKVYTYKRAKGDYNDPEELTYLSTFHKKSFRVEPGLLRAAKQSRTRALGATGGPVQTKRDLFNQLPNELATPQKALARTLLTEPQFRRYPRAHYLPLDGEALKQKALSKSQALGQPKEGTVRSRGMGTLSRSAELPRLDRSAAWQVFLDRSFGVPQAPPPVAMPATAAPAPAPAPAAAAAGGGAFEI